MNEFEKLLNTPYSELDNNKGIEKVLLDSRIDEESKIFIDTFNQALDKVFGPVMSTTLTHSLDYAKAVKNYDFSALVGSLSKVFEREMNNSIVQWIRWKNGIEMPFFYNKYRSGMVVIEVCGSYEIDINRKRDNRLASLSMGDVIQLIESQGKNLPGKINSLFEQKRKTFSLLQKCRNASSHTEVICEDQFIKFYKDYTDLVARGWFKELMDLKDKVKNNL